MKARVKATGEIGTINRIGMLINGSFSSFDYKDVEMMDNYKDEPDYWEKLKHQYAGMAMQGILAANATFTADDTAKWSIEYATALVEKLKNE